MRIKRKKNSIALLLFVILLLGIGYAALSTNLSINGSADVTSSRWDIHFENIQTKTGSVTPTTAASINSGGNTITYSVSFTTPGQFYEFNVDVKNAGTIDGMIETITSTVNNQPISNLPNYLEYYVTYSDGIEIEDNHLLTANSKETYTVHIGFKEDISAGDLPGNNQSFTFSIGFTDKQASTNAVQKPYYIYTPDYGREENKFDNYNDVINLLGLNFWQRVRMNNNEIDEVYLGFLMNNKPYHLRAFDTSFYNSNKSTLLEAFGSTYCEETYEYSTYTCHCLKDDFEAWAMDNGRVITCFLDQEFNSCYECNVVTSGGYCNVFFDH